MKQRTLRVLKYKYPLSQPNGYNMREKEDVGHFANMFIARITVENMTDPNLTVVCEYNENNIKLAQPEHLIEAPQMMGSDFWISNKDDPRWMNFKTKNLFRINRVNTSTKNNTITIHAEPAVNSLRTGITSAYKTFKGTTVEGMGTDAPDVTYYLNYLYGREATEAVQVYTDNSIQQIGDTKDFMGAPQDMRNGLELLGGKENSLVDFSGGQILKIGFTGDLSTDRFTIAHQKKLGNQNRNFILSSRNQISGIDITLDTSKVYGSVCHYFEQELKYDGNDYSYWQYIFYDKNGVAKVSRIPQLRTLGSNSWRAGSVYMNNWSEKGDLFSITDKDTPQQATAKIIRTLPTLAKQWESANATRLSDPSLNISVDLNSLTAFKNNPIYAELFILQLGDSVIYKDEQGGYDIKAQMNGFTYDLMLDQYTSLTIGNGTNNILERLQKRGI